MVFVQILGHLSGYSSNRNHAFSALRTFLQMVAQKITLPADDGQFIDKIMQHRERKLQSRINRPLHGVSHLTLIINSVTRIV
jgi:hypothetical protein